MKVLNHDVASLVKRLRRFREEMLHSVSSGLSEVSEHDFARLESYLGSLRGFFGWATSQPILDLPESSPKEIDLGASEPSYDIENDDLAMVVTLFDLIEEEIVNSQSARRSTGFINHDAVRFVSYCDKIEKFMNDYILPITPLDLPESSPRDAAPTQGRTGI